MTGKELGTKLLWRAVYAPLNVMAWYVSLHWMLTSEATDWLPIFVFCLVATVSITFVIVATIDLVLRPKGGTLWQPRSTS
jgi:hypothetical protein